MKRQSTFLPAHESAFLFFPFIFLFAAFTRAQTASPTVVASAGGFGQSSAVSVAFTLGETRSGTASGAAIFTQGFQQPDPSGTVLTAEPAKFFSDLTLFPNPTEGFVSLAFSAKKSFSASWEIVSETGQTVLKGETIDVAAGKFLQKIDLTQLPVGAHFFVFKVDKGAARTARLVKI